MTKSTPHDVLIIGSGPAGLTAAIYAARADLHPTLFAGEKWGGQLMLTSDIENFPGFIEALPGTQLMDNFRKQAERFETKIIDQQVIKVDFSRPPFRLWTQDQEYQTKSVIIATGAETKWLKVPGEQEFIGRGVSSCAPCDAFFFKNQHVIVVGGGDSAMEEALYLAKFASKVTLVHRRDSFRASKIMQDRVQAEKRIIIRWNTTIEQISGDKKVTSATLKNVVTQEVSPYPVDGIFVAIGHEPVSQIFKGQIELDEKGYIIVKNHTQSSIPGVFVAGDVHDHHYRQAITAAAFGCMAAMDLEKCLAGQPL